MPVCLPCRLRWPAAALALLAAGVAGYLLVQVTVLGRLPAFCGGGSGCEEVLTSRFSKVLGLPVAWPAMAAYGAAALGVWWAGSASPALRVRGAWLSAAAGTALVLGAWWFVFLQAAVIGHFCPWCMAAHAAGDALGLLALLAAWSVLKGRLLVPALAGAAGMAALAGGQWWGPAPQGPAPVWATLPAGRDFDEIRGGERLIGVGGGQLKLKVADEPHAGLVSAGPVLALMSDYACPRCRATHAVLREFAAARQAAGKPVTLVGLPLSIWHEANPQVGATEERFRHSHELARIVLAAARAKPACWDELDAWMFADDAQFPRTPEAARARAESLAGAEAFAKAYADPAGKAAIARNIAALNAWMKADDRIQGIPVLVSPGAPMLAGMINETAEIGEMLGRK